MLIFTDPTFPHYKATNKTNKDANNSIFGRGKKIQKQTSLRAWGLIGILWKYSTTLFNKTLDLHAKDSIPEYKMTLNKKFVIDFDSTFTQVEALDILGEISLSGDPQKEEKLQAIKDITDKGMDG